MSDIGDFDILAWIESGTVAQRSVVIYNDPALAAEYEDLARRLEAAERRQADAEASMGDTDEVAAILGQMEALHARWEASKATWVVQALSDEKVRELIESYPIPARPDPLPDDADEAAKEAHGVAMREWAKRHALAREDRNLAFIAAAVVRVETPRGTATSVPFEAVHRLRHGPHGAHRAEMLLAAVNAATQGDVEVPAPKSHAPSRTIRD